MSPDLADRLAAPQCAAVQALLPSLLDRRDAAPRPVVAHVEHCLACRAELARYRKLLRMLRTLDAEQVPLPEGAVAEILSEVSSAVERAAVRSALEKRRVAYVAGIAAGAVVALVAGAWLGVTALRRGTERRGRAEAA